MIKLLLLLILSTPAFAHFAKTNKLFIPPPKVENIDNNKGLDKKTYDSVIYNVLKVYGPIVKKAGYKLVINKKWTDGTVNSDTLTEKNKWIINAYGGLARYPGMTYDAYMLVLCHELGHHLGGYPESLNSTWASNEGEADYFSVMKGFREMTKNDVAPQIFFKVCEDGVFDKCCTYHKTSDAQFVCRRAIRAGLVLANVLHDLSGIDEPSPISLNTPDQNKVLTTDDDHPISQCRLDTYYNGSVCGVSYKTPFSDVSPVPGACSQENNDTDGYRNRCWYAPEVSQ